MKGDRLASTMGGPLIVLEPWTCVCCGCELLVASRTSTAEIPLCKFSRIGSVVRRCCSNAAISARNNSSRLVSCADGRPLTGFTHDESIWYGPPRRVHRRTRFRFGAGALRPSQIREGSCNSQQSSWLAISTWTIPRNVPTPPQ